MTTGTIRHEGYLVDVACLRKFPEAEMIERAHEHTRDCALHGHCIESGYGVVTGTGTKILLEPAATRDVVALLHGTDQAAGLKVEVTRVERDGEMHTTGVRLL